MLEFINASFYIIALYTYWKQRKDVDAYFMLMAMYTFTAIMCFIVNLDSHANFNNVSLIPFVYLFICILLSFSPLKGFSVDRIELRETNLIRLLTWVYIVTGIGCIMYNFSSARELLESGEWGMLRNMLYEDEDNIQLYNSLAEKLCKNIHGYIEPFGILMCFYYLGRLENNTLKTILLWISWLPNVLLGAMLVASRGLVITALLNVIILLYLFKNTLSTKVKKIIFVSLTAISVPIALYIIAVSVSRFGDDGAGSSAFEYLGHNMTAFNQGVFPMNSYMWGGYSLSYFYDLVGIHNYFNAKLAGYSAGTAFVTFIGAYYLDWGPIVTLLLIVVLNRLLNRITHKRTLRFSDLMVVLFFIRFYEIGIFSVGRGYMLSWLMLFVLYKIVNFAEKNKLKTI
jgi:oligosaccharide repeat unit polymerase